MSHAVSGCHARVVLAHREKIFRAMRSTIAVSLGLLLLSSRGLAQVASNPNPTPSVSPCPAGARSEFDFWLGDWDVYRDGAKVGRQMVRRDLDGCALVVDWWGPEGNRGLGVLAHDGIAKRWTQLWVTNQRPFLSRPILRIQDSTYTGPGVRLLRVVDQWTPPGRTERLTTIPTQAGGVRQTLEGSSDSGKTWSVIFDVTHRRP